MTAPFEPHELEWTPEKVARLWDFYGASPAHASQYFSAHSGRFIIERVRRDIGLRGRRVLDFGSGHGDLLAHLQAAGVEAEGLEFSDRSAARSRERVNVPVTVTRDLPSPLPDKSFGVVFLVEVVEHLLEDQVAPTLREVARVLEPAGFVVATAPNAEDLAAAMVRCPDCGAVFHHWQHQRTLSADSLRALFEDHGFSTHTSVALQWGPRSVRRLIRELAVRGPRPHLLYIGATPGGGR